MDNALHLGWVDLTFVPAIPSRIECEGEHIARVNQLIKRSIRAESTAHGMGGALIGPPNGISNRDRNIAWTKKVIPYTDIKDCGPYYC
jgi:hypothetical protein